MIGPSWRESLPLWTESDHLTLGLPPRDPNEEDDDETTKTTKTTKSRPSSESPTQTRCATWANGCE
jgi:hypothetical protein